MRRSSIAATILALVHLSAAVDVSAQSMDDLNLQVHGYATQGFIYTTNDNWNTTNSSDGSSAWTEAVVNVTVQPQTRLGVGIQARYYLLGNYGNEITLDWAQADYKVNDKFGFRVGKVKTPAGLLNEIQDIDPAYLWIALPQSIYPIASRTSTLAHFGGVAYGAIPLGETMGKLEYRAFGGERVIAADDGYTQSIRDNGLTVPDAIKFPVVGGSLTWRAPVEGLILGTTIGAQHPTGAVTAGPLQGMFDSPWFATPNYFARYERKKAMLAFEYARLALRSTLRFPGIPASASAIDQRNFYLMASYKLSGRLTGGLYYSSAIDRQAAFTSARYQKDWSVSGRYDFSPYLYLKVEQHFMDGTMRGFTAADNSAGLKPSTRMTLLKLGVIF